MKIQFVAMLFFIVVFASQSYANPVCSVGRDKAYQDAKKSLMDKYAPSYITVENLLESHMNAFDEICGYPGGSTSGQVLQRLKDSYYPSFMTIRNLYKSNMESSRRIRDGDSQNITQTKVQAKTPKRRFQNFGYPSSSKIIYYITEDGVHVFTDRIYSNIYYDNLPK